MRRLSTARSRVNPVRLFRLAGAPMLALCMGTVALAQRPTDRTDWTALRQRVLELGSLDRVPRVELAGDSDSQPDSIRTIFFDALPFRGSPTRVYAHLGLPAETDSPVPGVVLVHGGGGTAFREWVRHWNERGFAAISIAVEGQTDQRSESDRRWQRHSWAGPKRDGIYADSGQPLDQQWMYHAVADTILAGCLMRSLPEVDSKHVGLMGISWGGVVTSTVIGIDSRFAFAIPTYGCGSLADADNHWGRALGDNPMYRKVWDPMVRIDRAKTPTLWLSWTGDRHFPLDALDDCASAMPGPHLMALLPNMGHSHPAGWNPPDSYAFARAMIQTGRCWCTASPIRIDGDAVRVTFESDRSIDRAALIWTGDSGYTGRRTWNQQPATLRQSGREVAVTAKFPTRATAGFVRLHAGKIVACSDFWQRPE